MQLKQNPKLVEDLKPTDQEAAAAIQTLLNWIGENPEREGLIKTPDRVLSAYREFFIGYDQDPKAILLPLFSEEKAYQEMVLVSGIELRSHCEHHMLPITGSVDLAYVPTEGVVGLSKFARLVDVFAKRLQTQERMTHQIISTFDEIVPNKGVAIQVKARHHCMSLRGVKCAQARTTTQSWRGCFEEESWQHRFLTACC